MKKKIIVLLTLICAFALSAVAFLNVSATVETTNLSMAGWANWGTRATYDASTDSATFNSSDDYSLIEIPTVLSTLTDGKLLDKEGQEINLAEQTVVIEVTIKPSALVPNAPWIRIAESDSGNFYELWARIGVGKIYFNKNDAEIGSLTDYNLEGFELGDEYTYHVEIKGREMYAQCYSTTSGYGYISREMNYTFDEDVTPMLSVTDYKNAGTIMKDFNVYLKDSTVELGKYVNSATVVKKPIVNYNQQTITGGKISLGYADGTSETCSAEDFTVSGYSATVVGKQIVTFSKTISNQAIAFPVEIESVNISMPSMADWQYATYDAETDSATFGATDTYKLIEVPTILSTTTDGKLLDKEGQEIDLSQTTVVIEVTINPSAIGIQSAPWIRIAESDSNYYELWAQVGFGHIYFNKTEVEMGNMEYGLEGFTLGDEYTYHVEITGREMYAQCYSTTSGYGYISRELSYTFDEDVTPMLMVTDYKNAGTVVKDFKFYVASSNGLYNYVKSAVVESVPDVEYGQQDLVGGEIAVEYIDGTIEKLGFEDFDISGYDSTAVGEQNITLTKAFGNQSVTLEATVEGASITNLAMPSMSDWGTRATYDASADSVTFNSSDDYSLIEIPTILSGLSNGKIMLKDGTEKNISELTVVIEITIKPSALVPNAPWIRIAESDSGNFYELWARIGVGKIYFNKNDAEIGSLTDYNLEGFELGDEYTYHVEIKGREMYAQCYSTTSGYGYISREMNYTFDEDVMPMLSVTDYKNAGTIMKDFKVFVKDAAVADGYAMDMKVIEEPTGKYGDETLTGGKVEISYINGTKQQFTFAELTVEGYNANTLQTQTIKVGKTILNQKFECFVDVKLEDYITGIEVKSTKNKYNYGDEFDLTSLRAINVFASGATSDIQTSANDFSISGYNKNTLGEQNVTVTYGEKTYEVKIIVQDYVASYTVSVSNSEYLYGKDFRKGDITVTANYASGATESVSVSADDFTVSGYDKNTLGSQNVTVKYLEKDYSVTVNVSDYVAEYTVENGKDTYNYGEQFDFANLTVTEVYASGATKSYDAQASEFTCDFDSATVGVQEIIVVFKENNYYFDVTVVDPVNSITLKSAPAKTEYVYGEEINLTGAVITVSKSSGDTDIDVTVGMVSGYSRNTLGEQTVTVTYEGKTSTFTVTVEDCVLSITWKSMPTKTSYNQNAEIDLTGAVITATFNTKTEDVNVTKEMISGFDSTKLGEQTVTVTYDGSSLEFVVTVNEVKGGCGSLVSTSAITLSVMAIASAVVVCKKKK